MDLMEQTDMLIVAGGDGTLQEVKPVGVTSLKDLNLLLASIAGKCFPVFYFVQVITGLLRRADEVCTVRKPICASYCFFLIYV